MFGLKKKTLNTAVDEVQAPPAEAAPSVEVPEAPITLRGSAKGVRAYNKKALYGALGIVGLATLSAIMLPVIKGGGTSEKGQGGIKDDLVRQTLQTAVSNVPDFLSDLPSGSLLAPPEPAPVLVAEDPLSMPVQEKPIPLPLPGAGQGVPDLSGAQSLPTPTPARPATPTPQDLYRQQLEQRRYQLAVGALSAGAQVPGFEGAVPGADVAPNPYKARASVQGFGQQQQAAARTGEAAPAGPALPGAAPMAAGPDFRGLGPTDSLDNATSAGSKMRWNQQSQQQQGDAHYIKSELVAPLTPYEVKAGSVIPGVMISGINSDLPGEIIGQVAENVYDSVTGNHLLIPMGTRMVGVYNNRVSYGQDRVQVVWNRLVFPDGAVYDMRGIGGYDEQGYSGFNDKVNNHYVQTFGGALLFSVFSGAVKYATSSVGQTDTATASNSAEQATVDAFGQTMSQLGSEVMQRNLQVQPTLEIRRGYPFQILVTKDLVFSSSYGKYNN